MEHEIKLTETVQVVARSFVKAEEAVREVVASTRPNAGEVAITTDLERELATALRSASANRDIETAFSNDLHSSCQYDASHKFEAAAAGIVAQASWHDVKAESRSGADFGIVLVKPFVTTDGSVVTISSSHRWGILVQAKKRHLNTGWGKLSPNQEKMFESFKKYGVLLLYRFTDLRSLSKFEWQQCQNRQLRTVKKWLSKDCFPNVNDSMRLISDLGEGTIGTCDSEIIESTIIPSGQRTLIIHVGWPDGTSPQSRIDIGIKLEAPEETIHVRQMIS